MERFRTLELPQPDEDALHELLGRLDAKDGTAWEEFLEAYAPLIYRAISLLESDPDHLSDCFLFVCERLHQNNCKRLRSFRLNGSARFSTWLTVVVRNLFLDWHRHKFGRRRSPQTIGGLSAQEQEVYRLACQEGLSESEILGRLQAQNVTITDAWVEQALIKVWSLLPTQSGDLRNSSQFVSLEASTSSEQAAIAELSADAAESPEMLTIDKEQHGRIGRALRKLPSQEYLMLRLRYEEGLTLAQVARVCGLKDAQTVDRKIQAILETLRKAL